MKFADYVAKTIGRELNEFSVELCNEIEASNGECDDECYAMCGAIKDLYKEYKENEV